mmetsp:Transcript_19132/g.53341  ORF Transcript_19132/g.53341 Transcript_19132/m.53341 type:complete len:434 (-) Transcript_19132:127-1428(-)|eukprot:CAMPEP_0117656328 /NCGR_PEP_ID=MMETSP0804-20121206/4747_1 /TAXON_ID=1074897 /ORGANISM="Tetraselmis astigmatica, Strain CCMP880" /LENGTH=433 /DNA_ID=CAMNT_0005462725 /DNA_START=769 /DNA_END=2073 /DNA_ORIENTATION=+
MQWGAFLSSIIAWKELPDDEMASALAQLCCAGSGVVTAAGLIQTGLALFNSSYQASSRVTLQPVEEAALIAAGADLSRPSGAANTGPASSSAQTGSLATDAAGKWVALSLPGLPECLRTFLIASLHTGAKARQSSAPNSPGIDYAAGPSVCTEGLLWSLAMVVGAPGPPLHSWLSPALLFRQSIHGYSTNLFTKCVDGYPGPVLVLFAAEVPAPAGGANPSRAVLGAIVDGTLFTPPGLSAKAAVATRLLGAQPALTCIAPKVEAKVAAASRQRIAYFAGHSRRGVGTGVSCQVPTGMIGFGGTAKEPRIELDESGETLVVRRAVKGDLFQSGPLIGVEQGYGYVPLRCKVLEWEVWGLGGEAALEQQSMAQQREERFVQQRKHVDRAQFAEDWENNPDRAILGFAGAGGAGAKGNYSRDTEKTLDQRDLQQP